jgi:hypothetical protein
VDIENKHVKALVAARLKDVTERRLLAEAPTPDYRRHTEETSKYP